jgi:hypothetical protein
MSTASFIPMVLLRTGPGRPTTVENWTGTAYERREPVNGHWCVEGKTLTLSFGGNDRSNPFTFYDGQLVFPNIPNSRGFWEKIE